MTSTVWSTWPHDYLQTNQLTDAPPDRWTWTDKTDGYIQIQIPIPVVMRHTDRY